MSTAIAKAYVSVPDYCRKANVSYRAVMDLIELKGVPVVSIGKVLGIDDESCGRLDDYLSVLRSMSKVAPFKGYRPSTLA